MRPSLITSRILRAAAHRCIFRETKWTQIPLSAARAPSADPSDAINSAACPRSYSPLRRSSAWFCPPRHAVSRSTNRGIKISLRANYSARQESTPRSFFQEVHANQAFTDSKFCPIEQHCCTHPLFIVESPIRRIHIFQIDESVAHFQKAMLARNFRVFYRNVRPFASNHHPRFVQRERRSLDRAR